MIIQEFIIEMPSFFFFCIIIKKNVPFWGVRANNGKFFGGFY